MPQGMAIKRLVAPVARERPTLLEKVDWPIPPSKPDRPVPDRAGENPSADRLHVGAFPIGVVDFLAEG